MKLKIVISAISILAILYGCSHNIENSKSIFSAKDLRKDLKILRNVLEESHHGLYTYTPKKTFDAVFDSLQNILIDSMSDTDFYRLITLTLTDKIQCGHTGIFPPQGKLTKLIPMDIFVVDNNIYINRIYDSINVSKKTYKLESINGIDSKLILNTLREGIPADGNNNNFKDRILEVDFPMYFTQLVEEADTYKIQVADMPFSNDTTFIVDAYNWENLNKARSNFPIKRENKLDLKIIDSLSTAYLKIGSFEGWRLEKQGFDYDSYISNSFNILQKNEIKNLILDLRWNMGGDTDKGAKLLSYLYDKQFRFYNRVTASSNHYKHLKYTDKNWKWNFDIGHDHKKNENDEFIVMGMNNFIEPQPKVFNGNVYFLINGCSHSTASTVSALAQYLKIGKLIGESPSGAYSGYNGGNWIGLTLPNTKIYASIPIRSFHNAIDSSFYKTKFIQPDFLVRYTVDEKIKESDLELEKAIELIRFPNNNQR